MMIDIALTSVAMEQLQTSQISLDQLSAQELAQQKDEARRRLLSMEPQQAQQLVDQTLYPQYWQWSPENDIWDESIPTIYGETNP